MTDYYCGVRGPTPRPPASVNIVTCTSFGLPTWLSGIGWTADWLQLRFSSRFGHPRRLHFEWRGAHWRHRNYYVRWGRAADACSSYSQSCSTCWPGTASDSYDCSVAHSYPHNWMDCDCCVKYSLAWASCHQRLSTLYSEEIHCLPYRY